MNLISGINHIAVVTVDLGRFVDFYSDVFSMPVLFQENTPSIRYAILRVGEASLLYAAEILNKIHSSALPDIFEQGHLNHITLNILTESAFQRIRQKLLALGVSDGRITNLGSNLHLFCTDPDGMQVEVRLIVDTSLQSSYEPRPYQEFSYT